MSATRAVNTEDRAERARPGLQHHPCRAGPPWPGDSPDALQNPNTRHAAVGRSGSKRSVVHRLQGRVHARRQTVLLSAYRHRSRVPLSAAVRGHGVQRRKARLYGLRAPFQRTWLAAGDPLGQRRSVRFSERTFQSFKALGVVAATGHHYRTHQARSPAAEWPARTHAPDIEKGSHTPRRREHPAAAGQVR